MSAVTPSRRSGRRRSLAVTVPDEPVTSANSVEKTTMPTLSLTRLSVSTSVKRRSGTSTSSNSASTLTGSVGNTIAPKSNASIRGKPSTYWPTAPKRITEMTSPGTARTRIVSRFSWKDSRLVVAAPSKSSGGSSTSRMRSCESRTPKRAWKSMPSAHPNTEIVRPASRRAIVCRENGRPSRRTPRRPPR